MNTREYAIRMLKAKPDFEFPLNLILDTPKGKYVIDHSIFEQEDELEARLILKSIIRSNR